MRNFKKNMRDYQPFVTILIPVKNVAKYIKACLDALLNQSYPQDKYEILILDNNSKDSTQEIVLSYGGNVKLIQSGIDSPPKKYNQVLSSVKGEVVGLVDGDANVDKDWLKNVIEPLKDEKVAGAGGVILTQNREKLIPRLIGYELQDRYERMPKEIKRMASMHIVYKKDILLKAGGFDEKLKTGYDCEIGWRINEAGYKIIFVPEAKVYHHHRENLWAYIKQQYEYGKFALIRYFKKPKIFKGDEVASFAMISQPLFYLAFIILFILNFIFKFSLFWIFLPLIILLANYTYSSIRISIKYKDFSAIFLIILYIIRPIAWSLGALNSLIRLRFLN